MGIIRLITTIVMITLCAVILVYVGMLTVNVSGLHSADWSIADLIRDRQPIRIVQPEWVSDDGDLLFNWMSAEIKARIYLVSILWLIGVAMTIRSYGRSKSES